MNFAFIHLVQVWGIDHSFSWLVYPKGLSLPNFTLPTLSSQASRALNSSFCLPALISEALRNLINSLSLQGLWRTLEVPDLGGQGVDQGLYQSGYPSGNLLIKSWNPPYKLQTSGTPMSSLSSLGLWRTLEVLDLDLGVLIMVSICFINLYQYVRQNFNSYIELRVIKNPNVLFVLTLAVEVTGCS